MENSETWLAAVTQLLGSPLFWTLTAQWAAFAPLCEILITRTAIRRLAFPWWPLAYLATLAILGVVVLVLPLFMLGMLPLQTREHRTEFFIAFVVGGSISALLRKLVQDRSRHTSG